MPSRNAPAPRRGPPFAHKRGAQPTSGARAMTSEWVDYGWSVQLSRETTRRVERVQGEANSAYVLQIRRDRPVDAFSVRNALFWEHRRLPDPRLVSTPATDVFCFFAGEEPEDDDAYRASMQDVRRRYHRGGAPGQVRVHPLFGPMRDREFTVWPVEFDGGAWCTLVLRVRPRESGSGGGGSSGDGFADREVVDMAVVDPLAQGRDARRRILQRRLPTILAQGCIALRTGAVRVHDARAPDVAGAWETGYVAYAVARELLRRLKVLTWRRREGGRNKNKDDDGVDLVFGPWEEYYDVDAYRQHMLAGCAHQTVERSDYRVRLCMEVPSDGSMYDPEALSRRPDGDAPPDERFSYIFPRGENPDPVVVQVGGGGGARQPPLLAAAAAKADEVPSPSPSSQPVVIKQEIPDDEDEYYEYGAGAGAAVPRQPSVLAPYDDGQGVYVEVPGGGDGNDVAMRDTSVPPVAAVVAAPDLPASVADQQIIEISDDDGDDDEEEEEQQYMPAPRGQAPGALMMNPGRPILGFGPLPPIVPLAEAETGTITFGAPEDDGEFSDEFDDDNDDDDDDSMVEAEQVDLFAAPEPGFGRNVGYQFTPASAAPGMGDSAKRAREGDDGDDAASAKKVRYEGYVEID
ncbi:hypothetical protein F4809DRAFT_664447 [Biscogniauxia mediterranea]|nr:hypothetical protein F4809DRAFT_664447 [Biscogniauxia mediterranea]